MAKELFIFEDVETVPRRELFRVLGVPFTATQTAWLSVIPLLIVGILIALVALPDESIIARLIFGVVYGLLMEVTYLLHDIGHIIGGRSVGSAMNENLITNSRHVNIYHGIQDFPKHVHLSRALGGPLFNIFVGLFALGFPLDGHIITFFAIANLVIGFASFLPIPSIDGEVIWRELRNRSN
jgi:hypothetical protein